MSAIRKVFLISFLLLSSTSCSDRHDSVPGYIEGEYTYVASGVSGTLFNLYVERGQTVAQGDPLYSLDPQPEQAKVVASEADIAEIEAQLSFSKDQLQRQKKLYEKSFASAEDFDSAQTDFLSKTQQLSANKAQLAQTLWSLQQKKISAPIAGLVFDTYYRIGEKVVENRPVLAILAPQNIKVLFYIPEAMLSKITIGTHVTFACDGCKQKTSATVRYISPEAEYTPPVIYSKDTRYKLVYLIRADMPDDVAKKFHPGQPIEVYLPL